MRSKTRRSAASSQFPANGAGAVLYYAIGTFMELHCPGQVWCNRIEQHVKEECRMVTAGATQNSAIPGRSVEPVYSPPRFVSLPKKEASDGEDSFSRDRRTRGNVTVAAVLGGPAVIAATGGSGLQTCIHEHAHLAAGMLMYDLRGPQDWYLQYDSLDNFQKLLEQPSPENLKNYVLMHDSNQDGSRGGMWVATDNPSKLGNHFTPDQRFTIGSAAGPLSVELPLFFAYALGHRIRKTNPAMGYTLMVGSLLSHAVNSIYPASALFLKEDLGNDFTSISKHMGVHPVIPLILFAGALPAFALALSILDDRREKRIESHHALSRLIERGEITMDQIDESMKGYGRKNIILEIESRMVQLQEEQDGRGTDKKALAREFKRLSVEYGKFSDYLATQFSGVIEPERQRIHESRPKGLRKIPGTIVDSIKGSFRSDPVGASLVSASTGGSAVIMAKYALEGLTSVTGMSSFPGLLRQINTAGAVAGSMAPGISLVHIAASSLLTIRALRDEKSTGTDKAMAIAGTVLSALPAAGILCPAVGLPLALIGAAGSIALLGARTYWSGRSTPSP